MKNNDIRKIAVKLPTQLLECLNDFVPRKRRSRFIVKAIEEKLALLEQLAVLDETAGVWKDENHPEMQTKADIDQWSSQLRGG